MAMEKATRQQTKDHNTTLVLKTIYQADQISRADIARATSLTRTTVSDLVAELISAGLVNEAGFSATPMGKPPILVELAKASRQLICVDLGNDEFRGAVVNLRGEILHRHALSLGDQKGEAAVELVRKMLAWLIAKADAPLLGIGIGTPGPVDTARGIIHLAVNRGWRDLPLQEILASQFQLPIHIANDSHVAALAECAYGGHGHTPNLVLIKIGQGIGSGIVLGGRIHSGDGCSAGEIGHLSVDQGFPCTCGNFGCLETVASVPALLRQAQDLARQQPGSALGRWVAENPTRSAAGLSMEALQELFEQGDRPVAQLVRKAGQALGVVTASLAGVLNVRKIVLAGALSVFGDALLEALREEMTSRILPAQAAETEVVFSALGEDIVIRGASALVLMEQLDLP